MTERIDRFCEDLRVKLTSIDNDVQSLKTKIDAKGRNAEQDVRTQLESFKKRIEQSRASISAAQADIKKWVDERETTTREKLAEWKSKREVAKLQSRADGAERYAAAAAVTALAAIDEAGEATLEAWLARQDADGAQGTKAA